MQLSTEYLESLPDVEKIDVLWACLIIWTLTQTKHKLEGLNLGKQVDILGSENLCSMYPGICDLIINIWDHLIR